ncbi:MAG: hypothetical protein JWR02_1817 [Mucilaginibacter sp.]|nr:hypothetical protein [Mucilaginibacter sp.]
MKAKSNPNGIKITLAVFMSAIMLLACCTAAFGQAAATNNINAKHNYWGSLGFGPTTFGSSVLGGDLNAEIANQWVISAESKVELQSFLSSNVTVTTYDILAGKIFKQKFSFITVSAGLGLVDLNTVTTSTNAPTVSSTPQNQFTLTFPSYTWHDQYALNIPIEVQMYFVPVTPFAVGVGAYVNLNTIRTTAGFTVRLALGRMSTHLSKKRPRLPWQSKN